jgi:hypothetical protein
MLDELVGRGVRLYHKPYILPTESKIFAAIYIPNKTYLPAIKLSKEVINKFREQLKHPALKNPAIRQLLMTNFKRSTNHTYIPYSE